MAEHAAGAPLPLTHEIETMNAWVPCDGNPLPVPQQNRVWSSLEHFFYKSNWRAAMSPQCKKVMALLEGDNIYNGQCLVCKIDYRDLEQHVCSRDHIRNLFATHLHDGASVIEAAKHLWQKWLLPGGALRFNHASGAIERCRGQPPPDTIVERTAQTSGTRWWMCSDSDGQEYWRCGNENPFLHTDESLWQRFTIAGSGKICRWNWVSKMYFYEEDGFERGPWED